MSGKQRGEIRTGIFGGRMAVVLGLILLTLVGFILVSDLMGRRTESERALEAGPPARAPEVAPARAVEGDLGRAQNILAEISAAVSADDWARAKQLYPELEQQTSRLPRPQLNHPDLSPLLLDFYALYRLQLGRHLDAQEEAPARFAINQLAGILGELEVRLEPRAAPPELARLLYLAHEVALWSRSGETRLLNLRVQTLREAWSEARPLIIAQRGAVEPARRIDALMAALNESASPSAHQSFVASFRREVEAIRAAFPPPPPPKPLADGSVEKP